MSYLLEVVVTAPGDDGRKEEVVSLTGKELERVVDEDLADFEKFMIAEVDDSGPLHRVEKAILKTYLHWKTHAKKTSSSL